MNTELNDKSIWDEIYRKTDYKPGWDSPGEDYNLLELIQKHRTKTDSFKILDSGCGNGRNTPLKEKLESLTGKEIGYRGVDFAESAVSFCRKNYSSKTFFNQDMCANLQGTELFQSAPFDVVVDCGCFHAIPPEKREDYIQNIADLCAPEALLLIGAWYRIDGIDGEDPRYFPFLYLSEWFFNEKDIQKIWGSHFTLLDSRVDKEIYKGFHEGFAYFVLKRSDK